MPSGASGSPKDQLPSISKKVKCQGPPTESISPVLTHFWTLAKRLPAGCFSPKRYGTKGCIPAVVKSTVGSCSGTRDAPGIILCPSPPEADPPLAEKNSKNFWRSSLEVI